MIPELNQGLLVINEVKIIQMYLFNYVLLFFEAYDAIIVYDRIATTIRHV